MAACKLIHMGARGKVIYLTVNLQVSSISQPGGRQNLTLTARATFPLRGGGANEEQHTKTAGLAHFTQNRHDDKISKDAVHREVGYPLRASPETCGPALVPK